MKSEDGKYIFGTVKVGEKGQIVIPKEARTVMNIKPGDSLIVLGDENRGQGLAIIPMAQFGRLMDEIMTAAKKEADLDESDTCNRN